MLERQREGIAKAKAAGKYKGRPVTIGKKRSEMLALLAEGVGPAEIARRLGTTRMSVYRIVGKAGMAAAGAGKASGMLAAREG